jgi:hypothetical protein
MAITRLTQSTLQQAFPKYPSAWDGVSAVGSMDAISSVTLTSGTPSIQFNNIPQTYTNLQLRFNIFGNANNDDLLIRFNDNAASNYAIHELRGNGTSVTGTTTGTSMSAMYAATNAGDTTYPVVGIIDIFDYVSTSKAKVIKIIEGKDTNGGGTVSFMSGHSSVTNAITSINVFYGGGNINQYSSISLYGVK